MGQELYDIWASGHKWVHLDGIVYKICNTTSAGPGRFRLISKGAKVLRRRNMRVYMETNAVRLWPNQGWWQFYRQLEKIHTSLGA